MIKSISFIGAGNVSTHFAKAFFDAGLDIESILSRTLSSAKIIAAAVNAQATTSYKRISKTSDLYIIAVPDNAIAEVIHSLKEVLIQSAFVIHTSGATPIKLIENSFDHTGVIWPPQSLSKSKAISFNTVPLCYGATQEHLRLSLEQLIKKVSFNYQEVDDQQKSILHLAAVFANNFTNHLYQISYDLCQEHKLDFSLLHPIILETAQKVIGEVPANMQTGPAIRGDHDTISQHIALLKNHKEYRKLYSALTKSIQDHTL